MKMPLASLVLSALIFGSWLITSPGRAENVVPDSEAAQHVGQAVSVEGTITKVFKSKNGNTFLNFGGNYPDVTFVVWIPEDAPEATDPGLVGLQGKKVKISGTIQLYRGKPEIKVSNKEQIVVE
jgi:DNA/RNA endonuclease YhcR with UshA esterase domain